MCLSIIFGEFLRYIKALWEIQVACLIYRSFAIKGTVLCIILHFAFFVSPPPLYKCTLRPLFILLSCANAFYNLSIYPNLFFLPFAPLLFTIPFGARLVGSCVCTSLAYNLEGTQFGVSFFCTSLLYILVKPPQVHHPTSTIHGIVGAWIITLWLTLRSHHSFLKLQIFHTVSSCGLCNCLVPNFSRFKMSEDGSNQIRDFEYSMSSGYHHEFLKVAFSIGMLPKDPGAQLTRYTHSHYHQSFPIETFLQGESIKAVSLVAEKSAHKRFVYLGLLIGLFPETFLVYIQDGLNSPDFSSEDSNSVTLLLQGVEQALREAFGLPSTQIEVPRKKNFSQ
jgi:hypothetical protein